MDDELIVCVPGDWESREDFIGRVAAGTDGAFMLAGTILAHPRGQDHVELDFCDPDEEVAGAFEYGGQGRLTEETLARVAAHRSVAYLHFPRDFAAERLRLAKFTEVVAGCGGIAAMVETSGVAHEWERWFALLRSAEPFDHYCACVVLAGDERHFYSCGMHNFGLPDAQISREFGAPQAADVLNRFNYYQLSERPGLAPGHTFSLTADGPRFRLNLLPDLRHPGGDLFHNPRGLWEIARG